ncbi:MAG: COX15/CtaA family protein [Actinomycetota bacterium]
MSDRRFTRYAIGTLAFNLVVVLFGAIVRATGSGAGCGAHWPSCQGMVIPLSGTSATFVEFTHRASSGIALALVAGLVVWAVRTRPKGDAARGTAIAAGVLIVNEALIGAALVLFEWVAEDQSLGRAVSITLHLANTFLLLGALTLTAWFASGRQVPRRPFDPATRRLLLIGATALVVVGAAGAVTALGDTLFPPDSIAAGLHDDFTGVFLVRLRWIHPVLAVATAGYLLSILRHLTGADWARSLLRTLIIIQVGTGMINVGLLAPVWMQLVHLFLADAVWISFVVVGAAALAARSRVPVAA